MLQAVSFWLRPPPPRAEAEVSDETTPDVLHARLERLCKLPTLQPDQVRQRVSDDKVKQVTSILSFLDKKHDRPDWKRWADRPRTYMILSAIGGLEYMDDFAQVELTDIFLPHDNRTLPDFFQPEHLRERFLDTQAYVYTDAKLLEELIDASSTAQVLRHVNLEGSGDQHFRHVGSLGQGGYGAVDEVISLLSLTSYARKRVSRGKHSSEASRRAQDYLVKEIESLKSLSHKHLVKVFGSYTDKEYIAFLMQPVAECNLHDFLARPGGLRDRDRHAVRNFFGCLASAVHYLHRSHIRHRDLSSRNILIYRSSVYISDLGSSLRWNAANAEGSVTRDNNVPMSSHYMAPEIYKHQQRSSPSDMWSLGVVFLELSTLLVGRSLRDFQSTLEREARSRRVDAFIGLNPGVVNAWLQDLQKFNKGPRHDNEPLAWVRDLLNELPQNRPKSKSLMKDILECASFNIFCCIDCQPEFRERRFEYSHMQSTAEETFDDSAEVRKNVASILQADAPRPGAMEAPRSDSIRTWLANTRTGERSPMPGSFDGEDHDQESLPNSGATNPETSEIRFSESKSRPLSTPTALSAPVSLSSTQKQHAVIDAIVNVNDEDSDVDSMAADIYNVNRIIRSQRRGKDTGQGFIEYESPSSSDDEVRLFNERSDSSGSDTNSEGTVTAPRKGDTSRAKVDSVSSNSAWEVPQLSGVENRWIQDLDKLSEIDEDDKDFQSFRHEAIPVTEFEEMSDDSGDSDDQSVPAMHNNDLSHLRNEDTDAVIRVIPYSYQITSDVSTTVLPRDYDSAAVASSLSDYLLYQPSSYEQHPSRTEQVHDSVRVQQIAVSSGETTVASQALIVAQSGNWHPSSWSENRLVQATPKIVEGFSRQASAKALVAVRTRKWTPVSWSENRLIRRPPKSDDLAKVTEVTVPLEDGNLFGSLETVTRHHDPSEEFSTPHQDSLDLSQPDAEVANPQAFPNGPFTLPVDADVERMRGVHHEADLQLDTTPPLQQNMSYDKSESQQATLESVDGESSQASDDDLKTAQDDLEPFEPVSIPHPIENASASKLIEHTSEVQQLELIPEISSGLSGSSQIVKPTRFYFKRRRPSIGSDVRHSRATEPDKSVPKDSLPYPKRFERRKRLILPKVSPVEYIENTWESASSVATSALSENTSRILQGLSLNKWLDRDHQLLDTFCAKGNVQAVRVLLSKGCNPGRVPGVNRKQGRRMGPIVKAIKGASLKHNKCVKELIAHGVDVNVVSSRSGKTPLHMAIENPHFKGYEHLIRDLIEAGADTNKADLKDDLPIMKIFYGNDTGPLEDYRRRALALLLRQARTEVNIVLPGTLNTPLHLAVRRKDTVAVGMLLYMKANVNAMNATGTTPLLLTANQIQTPMTKDHRILLKLLLETKGIAVNEKAGVNERTALHYAVKAGDSAAVELLLTHGADPHCKDNEGHDALALAIQHATEHSTEEHVQIMLQLRDSMKTMWPRDEDQCDLELACKGPGNFLMQDLLDNGLIPNAKKGDRPILHRAIDYGNRSVVVLLTVSGAFVDAPNKSRVDGVAHAISTGKDNIAEYLVKAGRYKNESKRPTLTELARLIALRDAGNKALILHSSSPATTET